MKKVDRTKVGTSSSTVRGKFDLLEWGLIFAPEFFSIEFFFSPSRNVFFSLFHLKKASAQNGKK
jgi:hypothetical protein